jgi:hypothetical protein
MWIIAQVQPDGIKKLGDVEGLIKTLSEFLKAAILPLFGITLVLALMFGFFALSFGGMNKAARYWSIRVMRYALVATFIASMLTPIISLIVDFFLENDKSKTQIDVNTTIQPVIPEDAVNPKPTNFGPADFLAKGITNIINGMSVGLGNIGVLALRYYITSTNSFNLTTTAPFGRQCVAQAPTPGDPTSPNEFQSLLTGCAIQTYDNLKYLPLALLIVSALIFLVKYSVQGFTNKIRLSLSDFGWTVILSLFLVFYLDLIFTLLIDFVTGLFVAILSATPDGATTDVNLALNSLNKLVNLFDISKYHNDDIGLAVVLLVMVVVPTVFCFLIIGIFFFLRAVAILVWFVVGTFAISANLFSETRFFFDRWWQRLLKILASIFIPAILLRICIEIATNIQSTTKVGDYILIMFFIGLMLFGGAIASIFFMVGEIKDIKNSAVQLKRVVTSIATTAAAAGTGGATAVAGTAVRTTAPKPQPSYSVRVTKPEVAQLPAANLPALTAPATPNLLAPAPLTPQLLTNAVNMGMTQAFKQQQSVNERAIGAILSQVGSMKVALADVSSTMRQMAHSNVATEAVLREILTVLKTNGSVVDAGYVRTLYNEISSPRQKGSIGHTNLPRLEQPRPALTPEDNYRLLPSARRLNINRQNLINAREEINPPKVLLVVPPDRQLPVSPAVPKKPVSTAEMPRLETGKNIPKVARSKPETTPVKPSAPAVARYLNSRDWQFKPPSSSEPVVLKASHPAQPNPRPKALPKPTTQSLAPAYDPRSKRWVSGEVVSTKTRAKPTGAVTPARPKFTANRLINPNSGLSYSTVGQTNKSRLKPVIQGK